MTEQLEGQMTMCDLGLPCGKMSPEPTAATKGKTSGRCLKPSQGSKTPMLQFLCLKKENGQRPDASWETVGALPGEPMMLNFGEYPSEERGSTLSQILEANVPEKYYLSKKACAGILRRAERRGKALPPVLKEALLQMIERETVSIRGTTRQNDAMESAESLQHSPQESEADRISSPCASQSQETDEDCGVAIVEQAQNAVPCYDIGEARLRTPSEYMDVTPTLTARCGTGGNNVPAVVQPAPVFNEAYQHHGWRETDISGTLTAGQNGTVRGDTPLVTVPYVAYNNDQYLFQPVYCLQGNGIDRADTAGCDGKGWKEDTSYTLNTIDRPTVAYLASGKETVGTLMANAGTKLWLGNQEAFSGDYHIIEESQVRYIVRRLTPLECCRLQGFPDWWEEGVEGSDSARYKMWGNGIALPCAADVLGRIAKELRRAHND